MRIASKALASISETPVHSAGIWYNCQRIYHFEKPMDLNNLYLKILFTCLLLILAAAYAVITLRERLSSVENRSHRYLLFEKKGKSNYQIWILIAAVIILPVIAYWLAKHNIYSMYCILGCP